MSVSDIEWGVVPPDPLPKKRTGFLTSEHLQVAAEMRPGEWGRYRYQSTTQASAYAWRLRQVGLEALSRGLDVYFRCPV